MKFTKIDLLVILIPLVIVAVIYPTLPAVIPRQFGFSGKPTSYMNKEFLFLIAFLPYIIFKSYQTKRR